MATHMITPSSLPFNSTITSTTALPACSSFSSDQEEEYERAVAFLREFHSRGVVAQATFLHSTSLNAILEPDHPDEMLESDFSLALSVGQVRGLSPGDLLSSGSVSGSNNKTIMMKRREESFLQVVADVPPLNGYATANNDQQQQRRTTSRLRWNPSLTFPRMKKTITSRSLLGLDDSTSSPSSGLEECLSSTSTTTSSGCRRRSSSSLFTSCGGGGLLPNLSPTPQSSALDTDYYLGYDAESLPMTKRHRSSHCLGRSTS